MRSIIYDVLVIGAGPIGLACGIEAKRRGLACIIVDKGCLVNSIYNYPETMTFFSHSEKLEIGGVPFMSINAKPTRNEALEYYRRVTLAYELNVLLFNAVTGAEKYGDVWNITTEKCVLAAKNVVLATGFYDLPNKLGVRGEDLHKVRHYYKDPHYYAFQKVLIVGAMNSAVDAALETYRKGAEVTMVVRGDEIGRRVKYWVRPDIDNRIKEGSIKAYFNSEVEEILDDAVIMNTPEGKIKISNDFVLALTGYRPNYSLLDMFNIAIDATECKLPEHNPETMESNIQGIYLAGVVCGGLDTHSWFIENSRVHAARIMDAINIGRGLAHAGG